ncbi:MAG: transglutaminase family protein [Candidatus Thermoplasmatota archaeon]|nr:transglutaminase family protein [Candidatus Thermoplasmatota archaeon]
MFKNLQDEIDKGFFIPKPLLKNFIKTIGPLSFIISNHPDSIIQNIPAYRLRLKNHRLPWAHLDNESEFDSTKKIKQEYLKNPFPENLENKKYLRPTRFCESNAPEIRALAKQLRENSSSDIEFAYAAFNWVKNNKYLIFKPIGGALQTVKTKGGVCLDQLSLLAAIARAGGIPARYRLYGLSPTQEFYDLLVAPSPILRETFQALGFLDAMHGEAELFVNGKWIHGDPTFSDALSVGLGVTLSELGEEPGWRVRVEKSMDIRFEGFPIAFRHFLSPLFIVLRDLIDNVNNSLDDFREGGKRIIQEIGIEEYNRRTRKKIIKPVIPTLEEIEEFRKNIVEEPQPALLED